MRAVQILDTCKLFFLFDNCLVKFFLAERDHFSVCRRLLEVFPSLFRFERCGVLFVDTNSKELFKITLPSSNEDNQRREFENLVYFPIDMGCTGVAI